MIHALPAEVIPKPPARTSEEGENTTLASDDKLSQQYEKLYLDQVDASDPLSESSLPGGPGWPSEA